MATSAQNRATSTYRRNNVRQVVVRFYPKDADLLEWVRSQGGSSYLRSLAAADLAARRKG